MKKPLLFSFILLLFSQLSFATPSAKEIIKKAINQWRGNSSFITMNMTIHRPDWQRTMKMVSWNQGEKNALVRFTYPAKDAGSATLKKANNMWIYTPKLNRVIKLPSSMMSQSWMGSDFSYNNLAKSDQVINNYHHKIIKTENKAGHTFYTIESTPLDEAAVVWGKEQIIVRDDYILIEEVYFDQDMIAVKKMQTLKIANMGGRPYPTVMRMIDLSKTDYWTEVQTIQAKFDMTIANYIFTRSNLQNARAR